MDEPLRRVFPSYESRAIESQAEADFRLRMTELYKTVVQQIWRFGSVLPAQQTGSQGPGVGSGGMGPSPPANGSGQPSYLSMLPATQPPQQAGQQQQQVAASNASASASSPPAQANGGGGGGTAQQRAVNTALRTLATSAYKALGRQTREELDREAKAYQVEAIHTVLEALEREPQCLYDWFLHAITDYVMRVIPEDQRETRSRDELSFRDLYDKLSLLEARRTAHRHRGLPALRGCLQLPCPSGSPREPLGPSLGLCRSRSSPAGLRRRSAPCSLGSRSTSASRTSRCHRRGGGPAPGLR